MKRYTCIKKIKNSGNLIKFYEVRDIDTNKVIECTPIELKNALQQGKIYVDNLELMPGGRLRTLKGMQIPEEIRRFNGQSNSDEQPEQNQQFSTKRYTCVKKIKNSGNLIRFYEIKDTITGKIIECTPIDLKNALQQNKISIDNLELMPDGRMRTVKGMQIPEEIRSFSDQTGNHTQPQPQSQKPAVQETKHWTSDIEDIYRAAPDYYNYDLTVNALCNEYSAYAYNADSLNMFRDYNVQIEFIDKLYIIGSINCRYLCEIRKWHNTDLVDKFYISESTLKLLEYEYPSRVIKQPKNNIHPEEYNKHSYYHEVVIKLRIFSKIPQFKRLKLLYMQLNETVFDNKLDNKKLLIIGNYKKNTDWEDLQDCGGYHDRLDNCIVLRYNACDCESIMKDKPSKACMSTLLHEMAHAYTDILYGTNFEKNKKNYGSTLFNGVFKNMQEQDALHGRKFATTLLMVSIKTGYDVDELYAYHHTKKIANVLTAEYKELTNKIKLNKEFKDKYDTRLSHCTKPRGADKEAVEFANKWFTDKVNEIRNYILKSTSLLYDYKCNDKGTQVKLTDNQGLKLQYVILFIRPACAVFGLYGKTDKRMLAEIDYTDSRYSDIDEHQLLESLNKVIPIMIKDALVRL